MSMPSVPLLLAAAAGVGIVHSVLPDHWVPLAVIARANRWSVVRTAKVSLLASLGHVTLSLGLGIALAAAGLALRNAVIAEEGQVVGGVLVLTGLGFLIWALTTRGRGHDHSHGHGYPHALARHHGEAGAHAHEHGSGRHHHDESAAHAHDHGHDSGSHHHDHEQERHSHGPVEPAGRTSGRRSSWLAEIAVPFGVAASPDLTILPVFLAASAVGLAVAIGTLLTFALATLSTFVVLTVAATVGGYQVEWPWLEANGHVVSALVLLVVGVLLLLRV